MAGGDRRAPAQLESAKSDEADQQQEADRT
jgi:hypothetical protein